MYCALCIAKRMACVLIGLRTERYVFQLYRRSELCLYLRCMLVVLVVQAVVKKKRVTAGRIGARIANVSVLVSQQ